MLHAAVEPGRELDHTPVDLAHERPTIIGPIMIEPSLRRLSARGKVHILEPKVMQVLVALTRAEERILSRDDLIDVCWNGMIVGDASINRVISLLRTSLREVAGDSVGIQTVPKVGYRLLVREDEAGSLLPTAPVPRRARTNLVLIVVLAFALLGAAASYFYQRPASEAMTIAIVPIEASTVGDQFYASGLTSEIGARLADMSGVTIMAPRTTEQLANAGVGPLEIGTRLRADAVLAGKMAHEGDDVVLSLALYSVAEGRRTWTGQLRSPASAANDLPDRTLEALRHTLDLTVPVARKIEGIKSSNYSVYLVARGMLRTRDQDQIRTAETMLGALTNAEPRFTKGWAALAKAIALGRGQPIFPGSEAAMADAHRYSARALALDGNSPEALKVAGLLATDPRDAQRLLEKSISIVPDDAEAWLWLSNAYVVQGENRKSLDAMARVLMLDPLWDRSAQSPDAAAAMGEIALADRLDREVTRVAVEGWQRDLAQARIARRHGNWSEFLRLSRAASLAAPTHVRGELGYEVMAARAFLGLPFGPVDTRPWAMIGYRILRGETPSEADIRRAGLGMDYLFYDGFCTSAMPRLLMQQGRGKELLSYFDRSIGSLDEILKDRQPVGRNFGYEAVPYLAMALKQAGRTEEMRRIERYFVPQMADTASGTQTRHLEQVIGLARLAAVFDRPDMARKLVMRARAIGWPNSLLLDQPLLMEPLAEDPAFASLRGKRWFDALSAEIEKDRVRERREAGALATMF